MNFLNNIGVKNKLRLLLAAVLLVALIVQVFAAIQTRHYLIEGRKQEIAYLVDNATSLIHHFYQQREKLGDDIAKKKAFSAVRDLRYNNDKGYFWINDHDLTLLMHPLKPEKEGNDMSQVRDGDGQLHWQAMLDAAESKDQSGFVNYSYKGPQLDKAMAKISYVKNIADWNWIVGTGIYAQDIEDQFYKILMQSAMMFLAVIVMVMILTGILSRSILNPLSLMVKNMAVAANGNLAIEVFDKSRGDELGHLNRSFSQLLLSVRDLISHSKEGNQHIADAVKESMEISKQTVEGMNNQYAETDSLASAVEELTSTLQEVSSNTAETNQLTVDVHQQVIASNDKMNLTVKSVRTLSTSVGHASEVMTKLEEDIKQIDGILNVIRNISEQTNLLALNAAIEAARAGESGRGFAVVADEVRQLAQRTHESTEEIQTMTERLQAEALKAVSVMESSVEQAKEGEQFAVTTGEDLQQVTTSVNAVTERIAHIAGTVEQQSEVVMEVNRNVVSIRDIASQTKEGSEEMVVHNNSLNDLVSSTRSLLANYKT